MKEDKFVRVPHSFYTPKENRGYKTIIEIIGDVKFSLWFILQMKSVQMNMSDYVPIQISQISKEFSYLKGFKKPADIRTNLCHLKKIELIECDQLDNKTKPSELIMIKVNTEKYQKSLDKEGFSPININIFLKKAEKINTIGFMIYCLIFKNHNINLGGFCGNGYAEMSHEYIGRILGIKKRDTIRKYIALIESCKGIMKVIPQESYETTNEFGELVRVYSPNRYYVAPKVDSANTYYIENTTSINSRKPLGE